MQLQQQIEALIPQGDLLESSCC